MFYKLEDPRQTPIQLEFYVSHRANTGYIAMHRTGGLSNAYGNILNQIDKTVHVLCMQCIRCVERTEVEMQFTG